MAVNLSRKYKCLNRRLWNTVFRNMWPQNMLSNSGLLYNGLKYFLQFPIKLTNVNPDAFAFGEIPSALSGILVDFLSPPNKCWTIRYCRYWNPHYFHVTPLYLALHFYLESRERERNVKSPMNLCKEMWTIKLTYSFYHNYRRHQHH
jgi:hypothetical protein